MGRIFVLALVGLLLLSGLLSGCGGNITINLVPTTGDTANDAASAQNALPNLSGYGYTMTNANSITDAIGAVGGGGALLTGNAPAAALIAKLDDMVRCYQNVGAVAAGIYTQADVSQLLQGDIPKAGALAVVNTTRLARNLLPCALNTGAELRSFAATIEPCTGSGSVIRSGETLDYIYAATDPELCSLFAAAMQ